MSGPYTTAFLLVDETWPDLQKVVRSRVRDRQERVKVIGEDARRWANHLGAQW